MTRYAAMLDKAGQYPSFVGPLPWGTVSLSLRSPGKQLLRAAALNKPRQACHCFFLSLFLQVWAGNHCVMATPDSVMGRTR